MTNFDLIFDNGGGITLQTADYCHFFAGDTKQAAQCTFEIINEAVADHWDGNEPEHRMQYDPETERNGGYDWVGGNDVEGALHMPIDDRDHYLDNTSGHAQREFFGHLFGLSDAKALNQ